MSKTFRLQVTFSDEVLAQEYGTEQEAAEYLLARLHAVPSGAAGPAGCGEALPQRVAVVTPGGRRFGDEAPAVRPGMVARTSLPVDLELLADGTMRVTVRLDTVHEDMEMDTDDDDTWVEMCDATSWLPRSASMVIGLGSDEFAAPDGEA